MLSISRKKKWFLFKLISLFSVVRIYNILIIILAQFLASIYIFSGDIPALQVVFDFKLIIIILASSIVIASGYIINNFYDSKRDIINKPFKSKLDRIVSQKTKLTVYFVLNFFVFFIAFFVSLRAVIFFSAYIFLVWLYSHKLNKILFIGNLSASFLAILPFFAILLYFKNFYFVIFIHAIYLFIIILIREIIKDLESIRGDISQNYQTIPIVFGEKVSKNIIYVLILCTIIPMSYLVNDFDIGYMDLYFYLSSIILIIFLIKLSKAKSIKDYNYLHNTIKIIILIGIISVVLIDPQVIVNGRDIIFSKI